MFYVVIITQLIKLYQFKKKKKIMMMIKTYNSKILRGNCTRLIILLSNNDRLIK